MAKIPDKTQPSIEPFVKTPFKLARTVSHNAALVYLGFADHVNNKRRDTIVAVATVAKELCMSIASVNRGLRELHEAGFMEVQQRGFKQSARRIFYLQPRPPKKDAVSMNADAISPETRQLDSLSNYTLEQGDDPVADTCPDDYAKEENEGNVPIITGWISAYRPGGFFRKAA